MIIKGVHGRCDYQRPPLLESMDSEEIRSLLQMSMNSDPSQHFKMLLSNPCKLFLYPLPDHHKQMGTLVCCLAHIIINNFGVDLRREKVNGSLPLPGPPLPVSMQREAAASLQLRRSSCRAAAHMPPPRKLCRSRSSPRNVIRIGTFS